MPLDLTEQFGAMGNFPRGSRMKVIETVLADAISAYYPSYETLELAMKGMQIEPIIF